MTLHIDPIESFWIGTSLIALAITFGSLFDALAIRSAVRLLPDYARRSREIAAEGAVRREALRIIMAGCFVIAAVPSLFNERVIDLGRPEVAVPIIALILAPLALATTTYFDARDRRQLSVITAAELVIERDTSITRLERKIDENTRISQKASDHAEEAYHEANNLNLKIADQGAQIVAQGERQDRRDATADNLQTVADDTAEKVSDIHDATVPGEAGA